MKDRMARALAIVALVFMGIFLTALTLTLVDYRMLNGSVGYIALTSGVLVLMIFIALKADGRGFSMTKMNNDIEMEKIEKALREQEEREKSQPDTDAEKSDNADGTAAESAEDTDKSETDSAES